MTASQVLGPALATSVRALRAAEAQIRLDQETGVHELRIAARRMRSILRATSSLFTSDTDLAPGLRRAGREAGPIRNADVVHRRVLRLLAAEPPGTVVARLAEKVAGDLEGQRRRHWGQLVEYLDAPEFDTLTRRLDAFADLTPWSALAGQPAADVLVPLFELEWRRFESQAVQLRGTPVTQVRDETLHDLRKQAKSVRYLGDAMKPVLGAPARKVRKRVRGVQTVLGDLNDALHAASYLQESLSTIGETPAERYILRDLHEQEVRGAHLMRTEFLAGLAHPRRSTSAS